MSVQRARINCQRCYEMQSRYNESGYNKKVNRLQNSQAWVARNEALRALEKVEEEYIVGFEGIKNALTACEQCDYSRPSIVKYIENDQGFKEHLVNRKEYLINR